MAEQIYNPILPLNVYIPDGEPRIFGDRLYLYGSHDRAGGTKYCELDYELWSAPVSDLRSWSCHGTSYMKRQDPLLADGKHELYAPDCVKGPDGRYYLYYCFSEIMEIGVAVSDCPEGPFEYLGHVSQPENIPEDMNYFDPGLHVDDDGRVYIYFGFRASYAAELESDMLTLKSEPVKLIPNAAEAKGTGFAGHGFFEASSMRKIDGRYYFIYSDENSHSLCYAVSDQPLCGFEYGGVLISNGDIGLSGRTKALTQIGNTHGSIAQLSDAEGMPKFYVFYHRQTNGTEYSRQACAEEIRMDPEGRFIQTEITSCGLNGGPLVASGTYPAAIACHIADRTMPEKIDYSDPAVKERVRVTEEQNTSFITGIKNRTKIGFKYFQFMDADLCVMEVRGSFFGNVTIAFQEDGKQEIGEFEFQVNSSEWDLQLMPIVPTPGRHALYFYFRGTGTMDLKTIGFVSA